MVMRANLIELQRRWCCDICGRQVTEEKVTIEWVDARIDGEYAGYGWEFICDKPACRYSIEDSELARPSIGRHSLTELIHRSGRQRLNQYLLEGRLSNDDYVEMTNRIWVPEYELARPHLRAAFEANVFELRCDVRCLSRRELRKVIAWAISQGRFCIAEAKQANADNVDEGI
jgi:hypothetical protein